MLEEVLDDEVVTVPRGDEQRRRAAVLRPVHTRTELNEVNDAFRVAFVRRMVQRRGVVVRANVRIGLVAEEEQDRGRVTFFRRDPQRRGVVHIEQIVSSVVREEVLDQRELTALTGVEESRLTGVVDHVDGNAVGEGAANGGQRVVKDAFVEVGEAVWMVMRRRGGERSET